MGQLGGKRPGAGRPKGATNKDRRAFIELMNQELPDELLLGKLKETCNGVTVAKPDGEGGVKIYQIPPNREAIQFAIEQKYGKAKQSVDLNATIRTLEDELEDLPE